MHISQMEKDLLSIMKYDKTSYIRVNSSSPDRPTDYCLVYKKHDYKPNVLDKILKIDYQLMTIHPAHFINLMVNNLIIEDENHKEKTLKNLIFKLNK